MVTRPAEREPSRARRWPSGCRSGVDDFWKPIAYRALSHRLRSRTRWPKEFRQRPSRLRSDADPCKLPRGHSRAIRSAETSSSVLMLTPAPDQYEDPKSFSFFLLCDGGILPESAVSFEADACTGERRFTERAFVVCAPSRFLRRQTSGCGRPSSGDYGRRRSKYSLVSPDTRRWPLSRFPRSGGREVDLSYLRQIAEASDRLGYYGVLLPTGRSCEELLGDRFGNSCR